MVLSGITWHAIRRLQQPELALQARQSQHPVLPQGSRKLFRGQTIDLVTAIGNEVEYEAELAEFLMPVVSQLNDGDKL